jgi:hypothetical protein
MIFRAFNRLDILDEKAVRIPRNPGGGWSYRGYLPAKSAKSA